MGETNTRFANVMSRIARGSNRRVIGCLSESETSAILD
jgi:hypothetical protein